MSQKKERKPPSVKQLLAEARRVPKKQPYTSADEVGPIIELLHVQKGFSFKEVAAWFETRGMKWSLGGMTHGWKRWKARQPRKGVGRTRVTANKPRRRRK